MYLIAKFHEICQAVDIGILWMLALACNSAYCVHVMKFTVCYSVVHLPMLHCSCLVISALYATVSLLVMVSSLLMYNIYYSAIQNWFPCFSLAFSPLWCSLRDRMAVQISLWTWLNVERQ